MRFLFSENQLSSRRVALLVLSITLAQALAAGTLVGDGVTVSGGGLSTGGVYANHATIGQIAGPIASSGVYQILGGLETIEAETGNAESPRIERITVFPDGHCRVRVRAGVGAVLRIESSEALGAAAHWQADGSGGVGNGAEVDLDSLPSATARRFYRARAN